LKEAAIFATEECCQLIAPVLTFLSWILSTNEDLLSCSQQIPFLLVPWISIAAIHLIFFEFAVIAFAYHSGSARTSLSLYVH
jgi:hypothetical protein